MKLLLSFTISIAEYYHTFPRLAVASSPISLKFDVISDSINQQ